MALKGTLDLNTQLLIRARGVSAGTRPASHLTRLLWPGVLIDVHQPDAIASIVRGYFGQLQELAIKGATASGKGTAVAMGVNLWLALAKAEGESAKVIVTSVRYEHACNILLAEVVKWHKASVVPLGGE